MDLSEFIVEDILKTLAFIVLYFLIFIFAKWMKDFFTPYSLNEELVKKDNLAVAITMSGYYLATVAIFAGALTGPTYGFKTDIALVGGYSILGLIFLNASRYINDKVILRRFCNIEQLTLKHNLAVSAIQFGTYLATGLVAAGAVTGSGGGVVTAIVFFILGQISLLLFALIYNLITPFCIHDELEKKNLAVGVAMAGNIIALGIIILNGVAVDFIDWKTSIIDLVTINIIAFVFLPLVRIISNYTVVPGDSLSREIVEDKNVGAGFLEATIAISFAVILKILL